MSAGSAGPALGIDLGTSGCRVLAWDPARDAVLAQAEIPLPPPCREGEASEQDPEAWWAALAEAVRALPQAVRQAVRRIAVDGTSGTLLLADADGRPLAPARLYDDARGRAASRRIAAVAPAGSGAHGAGSSLAKLLVWLEEGLPAGTAQALHPADWLTGRLTGLWGVADENSALKLGWDPLRREWPAWLEALAVPRRLLARVEAAGKPLGPMDPAVAESLGLPRSAVVCAGTTDSVAGFLATPASRPGDAVTSLGSTLALKLLAPRPVFSPPHGVYSHRVGGLWLAGGASNTGGAVLARFFDPHTLAALSARIDPERPSGLDYYPLPAPGERFPVADPRLPPRLDPRPADDARFLHGLLEGITRIEAEGYRLLERLGAGAVRRVWTVGGGARNPVWTRIRARMLGVPVTACPDAPAALGAARLAAGRLPGCATAAPVP